MKSKAEINRARREQANKVAARLARKLHKPAPKCIRVTSSRGHAYSWRSEFTVPVWAFEGHPAMTLAYVLHECCHCFASTSGHGPTFLRLEAELLEQENIRIIRRENGLGTCAGYIHELRDLSTGEFICDRWGRVTNRCFHNFDFSI